jgi:hypothetical protein
VLWFTLWFMVILKIPILYLAWVIWYAVKDPPDGMTGEAGESLGGADQGPGGRFGPRRRARRPARGPHGSPARRPARPAVARARTER